MMKKKLILNQKPGQCEHHLDYWKTIILYSLLVRKNFVKEGSNAILSNDLEEVVAYPDSNV